MLDTHIENDTRKILVGHVFVKCLIQKIFEGFVIILTQFYYIFKKKKYINFLKTQTS